GRRLQGRVAVKAAVEDFAALGDEQGSAGENALFDSLLHHEVDGRGDQKIPFVTINRLLWIRPWPPKGTINGSLQCPKRTPQRTGLWKGGIFSRSTFGMGAGKSTFLCRTVRKMIPRAPLNFPACSSCVIIRSTA